MPYTTGAAPVRYFNLQTLRAIATAETNDWSLSAVSCHAWMFSGFNFNLSKTAWLNLSISLSVTSHKFATRVGLV